jgi:hypothetical protein
MSKIPSYLLSLAGEYRVCSELNLRGVFATVTYGNRKSVDVYAISDRGERALKIEVKTSQRKNFVTNFKQKYLNLEDSHAPDFWVLLQVQFNDGSRRQDRFFVLTHGEMRDAQKARDDVYSAKYFAKHARQPDASTGVDNVLVEDVAGFEDAWEKIIKSIGGPEIAS